MATVMMAAALVAAAAALLRAALWPRGAAVLPRPLPVDGLVYGPDALPGARDVATPYGSVRVYEFGPARGPKVLLVHGISTPCITLGRLAHRLVARGCRVMLFDLFGRGFSDGVGDLPHDARLYASQMLCVLASSPLPWTGTHALRLVGYSLGGGVAIHFANAFPHLVASLVLLAPSGLIRRQSFGAVARFVFSSGVVPDRLLAVLARRRLQTPIAASRIRPPPAAAAAAAAEAVDLRAAASDAASPLEVRVLDYVRWMVVHHAGFVPAFTSCIRSAPLTDQHDAWRRLAARPPGSTAVLLAAADEIVDADDYTRHGLPLAGGRDKVVWRVVPGSHDFVMTHVDAIMDELDDLWGVQKTDPFEYRA